VLLINAYTACLDVTLGVGSPALGLGSCILLTWVSRFILPKASGGAPHIYCQPFEIAMVEPNEWAPCTITSAMS